jgi:curved DNA-binding protein CbpA
MEKGFPDYYSILKVQPDASQEVIKAGYRKLMVTRKMHPDLGGTHEIAAQINEAYAVLGDRVKRTAYARMYLLQRRRDVQSADHAKEQRSGNGIIPWLGNTAVPAGRPANSTTARCCPLCRVAVPQSIGPETRCESCRSPLSPPPQPGSYGHECIGRRASSRTTRKYLGKVTLAGQSQDITVTMRDLSLNGISFYSDRAIAAEQVFKFLNQTLEAVAVVVSCRRREGLYSVHARLLTVAFHCKVGVFVSLSG